MNLKSLLLLWAQGNPMVATQEFIPSFLCVVLFVYIVCVCVCVAIENEPC